MPGGTGERMSVRPLPARSWVRAVRREERDVMLIWTAVLVLLAAALLVLWCFDAYAGDRSLEWTLPRPLPHYAVLEIQRTRPGTPWPEDSIGRREIDDYCRPTHRRVPPPRYWEDIYDCGFSVTGESGDYIYRARVVVPQDDWREGRIVVDWMPETVWCVESEPGGCPGYLAQERP